MFAQIDGFLIDKVFQPISNWFQKLTGKDCFFLSRTLFIVYFLALVLETALDAKYLFLNVLACMGVGVLIWKKPDFSKESSIHEGVMNSERIETPAILIRLLLGASLLLALYGLVDGETTKGQAMLTRFMFVENLLVWSGMYLKACTPFPPCKSWVRKLVEKLKAAVDWVVTPTPEPVKVHYGS